MKKSRFVKSVSRLFSLVIMIALTFALPTLAFAASSCTDYQSEPIYPGVYYDKWGYHNCYAYALNRCENSCFYYKEREWQIEIGDISSAGHKDDTDYVPLDYYPPSDATVDELAEAVKKELRDMGYTGISSSDEMPLSLLPNEHLICLRQKVGGGYHFMRYDAAEDAWYHKSGSSAPLRFTGDINDPWHDEFYNGESMVCYSENAYIGTIIYIKYTKNQIVANTLTTKEIKAGKDIMCELNITAEDTYTINIEEAIGYPVVYELYDSEFDKLIYGSGRRIDDTISLDVGKYYLRISFQEDHEDDDHVSVLILQGTHAHTYDIYSSIGNLMHKASCRCGESINQAHTLQNNVCTKCNATHIHAYTGWKKYSSTKHIEQCGCGATGTVKKNHVTMQTLEPGTLKSCLECGAIMSSLGPGFGEIGHLSALKFSINGSYILPNGIIVLVDEDIEAYFNGTLVFYDRDELPETE